MPLNMADLFGESDLRRLLRSRVNQQVTISTAAGSVTGTLTTLGSNFLQLNETSGDIVLIPFHSITAFY